MASYETDHNIQPSNNSTNTAQPRRLDLSSFYSHLEYVNTASASATAPPPRQSDVAGAYRMLANAYQVMQGERTGVADDAGSETPSVPGADHSTGQQHFQHLQGMIDVLMASADQPPSQPDGVPRTFFDELERVSKQEIKQLQRQNGEEMSCPICRLPFLEDERPLVVRLRCSKLHLFDLECLQPWLTLNPTCPLDRQRLVPEQKGGPAGADADFRSLMFHAARDDDQRQASSNRFAAEEMSEEVDDMYG